MQYTAYEIQIDIESAIHDGESMPSKAKLVPITKKKDLVRLVKEEPGKIFLQLLPSVGDVDSAYQGPLMAAPKTGRYLIIGTEKLKPPSNSFEAMMQREMGSVKKTFSDLVEWSERTKKWRIPS